MTHGDITLTSCEYVPLDPTSVDAATLAEPDSFPEYAVKGTANGQPFEANIAIEFDGRDVDYKHMGGFDPEGDPDLMHDLVMAVAESEAYKTCCAAYYGT